MEVGVLDPLLTRIVHFVELMGAVLLLYHPSHTSEITTFNEKVRLWSHVGQKCNSDSTSVYFSSAKNMPLLCFSF